MPARPRVDRLKTIFSSPKSLDFAFRATGYPEAPLQNGVSAFLPQLHRITIRFCKQSESSVGVRNYIEKYLVDFAKENPTCAVYVVPARQCTPTLRAEYANGRQVHVNVKNMPYEQLSRYINYLRTRSGLPQVKFLSRQTSSCKSIQGMWNPVLFVDPKQNLYQLPAKQFSPMLRDNRITATEYIMRFMYQNDRKLATTVNPFKIGEDNEDQLKPNYDLGEEGSKSTKKETTPKKHAKPDAKKKPIRPGGQKSKKQTSEPKVEEQKPEKQTSEPKVEEQKPEKQTSEPKVEEQKPEKQASNPEGTKPESRGQSS